MGASSFFYLVKLWQEAGCHEGHRFSGEDLAGYQEPVALQELARDAEGPLAAHSPVASLEAQVENTTIIMIIIIIV